MVEFQDFSAQVLADFKEAIQRAKIRCGSQAEGYAKDLCPTSPGGGTLKNSIGFKLNGDNVDIGTNTRYAIYVEMGTGIYTYGGRPTPWHYQDANGQWHTTRGQAAKPYLKPALADHHQTYLNIIADELKGG